MSQLTEIASLGEFALVKKLTQDLPTQQPSTLVGVGEDCAVLQPATDELVVLSSELFCEGVHFDLSYTPLKHLGYKLAVATISDLCAANATPTQLLVNLGLPARFTVEATAELFEGIKLAAQNYQTDIVGGDTTAAKMLTVSITAIGKATKTERTHRHGAAPNQLICVSGDLGGAYLGLMLLEREKRVFTQNAEIQPDLEGNNYILQRQLRPEARTDFKGIFEQNGFLPTAIIDISDGIASDIQHICVASDIGCKIYEEKIPLDPQTIATAQLFNLDVTMCALNGGEDYELLFVVEQAHYEKIKNHPDITIIGYTTEAHEGKMLVTRDNTAHELLAQGWKR